MRRFLVGIPLAVLALLAPSAVTPTSAADAPPITGYACDPGKGVTVAVDFTDRANKYEIGCAQGSQTSIADALTEAGFTFSAQTFSFGRFLCSINGTFAYDGASDSDCLSGPTWGIFISTTDGEPDGPPSQEWVSSMQGIDSPPVPADTYLLFQINPQWPAPSRTPIYSLAQVKAATQPGLSVSPTPIAFGDQQVATTSAPTTVTVTNTGTSPLVFAAGAVSLTGDQPGEFGVTSDTCSGATVAAAGTCTVAVQFAPTSTGNKTAKLTLVSNAAGSPHNVTLTGTGTAAPTPPPAQKKKVQKPANAKGKAPARIATSGTTVITGKNARTNAGKLITTRVRCGARDSVTAGEVRYCSVIRGPKGKVSIRTYGRPGLKVVVVQSAPATDTFKAYKKRTVYINGTKR